MDTITTHKKKRGLRCEFTIDAYTDTCIEKIKALGFGSRKAAITYAIQRTAEAIGRGEIVDLKDKGK